MYRISISFLALALSLSLLFQRADATPTSTGTLTVITWNVESGGADPVTIAGQIAAFDGVDLWGLTEVNGDDDALLLENGAEVGEAANFNRVTGTTGGADRLVAIYDDDRFDLLGSGQLDAVNLGGNVRASLVITLEETATDLQFIFMVNHLYRTNDDARHAQATILNTWAGGQTLPVITVGDFNFDYALDESMWDTGYDNLVANGRWAWVKPPTLVTTQCSGFPCAFNSVLDFVFVAGPAQSWQAAAGIVVRPGDFPDDMTTSDHRPVQAVFTLPGAEPESFKTPMFLPLLRDVRGAVRVSPPAGAYTGTPTPTATSTSTATPTIPPTATATTTPTATEQSPDGPCPCEANTLNCSDFDTQTEAQACHDHCEALGKGDIHGLDGNDDDGLACESLPGGFRVVR